MFNDNTDPMLDTNMVDRLEQKVHMMEELGIDDPITFSSRTLKLIQLLGKHGSVGGW